MKKMVGTLIGIVVIIVFFLFRGIKQTDINKAALEDLDLQLVGIVDSVDKGKNYHGYGIIRLKIISSNLQEYDPRGKQEFYFCIIKNGMAEVYDHTYNTLKGDTLAYDIKLKLGAYIRNGKKENEGSISINANKDYYDYIKKNTMFK